METVFYPFPYMTRHVSEDTNQRRTATVLPYVVCVCVCVCIYMYINIYIFLYNSFCLVISEIKHGRREILRHN